MDRCYRCGETVLELYRFSYRVAGAPLPPSYDGASLEESLRSFSGVDDAPEWTALLLQILVFEPTQRLGMLEILDHPWLKNQ